MSQVVSRTFSLTFAFQEFYSVLLAYKFGWILAFEAGFADLISKWPKPIKFLISLCLT
jgi:hypothetical protein